ncbi:MAG: radical SAM protein [Bacillota bacterium]
MFNPDKQLKTPNYLKMEPEERKKRSDQFYRIMNRCTICPHQCRVNRLQGETGRCRVTEDLIISSAGPHFGEERELVGPGGSGTIFFVNCNLDCVYCQNWTISTGLDTDRISSIDELARIMIHLQERGCSNINLVSPTPYLYHITAAIDKAANEGLRLPVVYNCGGYESVGSLKLLEGFIDIYMPDAKYGSDETAETYSGAKNYYTCLKEALKEMQRQVADLETGPEGVAYRGLLLRHLVLPEGISGSEEVARMLAEEVSPNTAVNVMAQYYPSHKAGEYPPLRRQISSSEFSAAREAFRKAGLRLL